MSLENPAFPGQFGLVKEHQRYARFYDNAHKGLKSKNDEEVLFGIHAEDSPAMQQRRSGERFFADKRDNHLSEADRLIQSN
jgi:tRNA(His) 5'-end guanylyltransferase